MQVFCALCFDFSSAGMRHALSPFQLKLSNHRHVGNLLGACPTFADNKGQCSVFHLNPTEVLFCGIYLIDILLGLAWHTGVAQRYIV